MAEQAFVRSLFSGVVAESLVFPYPSLGDEELATVHRLLAGVRRLPFGAEGPLPVTLLRGMKDLGLFGVDVPVEHGGLALSAAAAARVLQEVAGHDLSAAAVLAAHGMGLSGLLLFGTDAQKRAHLPAMARGEAIAAFALAELGAGSDAAALQTHAEPVGAGYRIDGSKAWVTAGALADVFTVFARTSPREEGTKPKITAFLVERARGAQTGPPLATLGARGAGITRLYLDGVSLSEGAVLGERGRGFGLAAEVLSRARVGLAAMCVGMCRRLVRMAVERAQERRAFGRPVGEFSLIRDKIASITAGLYGLESMVYLAAATGDAVESAISRVHGTEVLASVVEEALAVAGALGYAQDAPYERLLRDARFLLAFDGTNETLRCFIALSGMSGPARELAEVARAIREPIKGFGLLSDFAVRKARTALGRERLTRAHPALAREAALFEERVADLSKSVERSLREHGSNLHEMQYTQRRLAQMAADLFGLAAVIARATQAVERRGEEGARRELDLTSIVAAAASERLAATVAAFAHNDDQLRKTVADRAYADGGYPLDVV